MKYGAYLFDVDGYETTITPFLGKLSLNQFDELKVYATQSALTHPYIWLMMENFGYQESDLGHEEDEWDTVEGRVRFWMMIVLAHSCQNIYGTTGHYPTHIRELLQPVENKEYIEKLLFGRPLSELLLQEESVKSDLSPSTVVPFWCKLAVGWLGPQDIDAFSKRLPDWKRELGKLKTSDRQSYLRKEASFKTLVYLLSLASHTKRGLLQALVI